MKATLNPATPAPWVVAVLVPAFNEADAIAGVIREYLALSRDFAGHNLRFELHIIDNGSTDGTAKVAASELHLARDCHVHRVAVRGKGNAVRWAFSNIQGDFYVLVDADLSYSMTDIPALVAIVANGICEMAVGDRLIGGAYRKAHGPDFRWAANEFVSWVIGWSLQQSRVDALSGLRVLHGPLARSMDLREGGFALETELMFEAARLRARIHSLPAVYRGRPAGQKSKLVTSKDGPIILWTLVRRLLAHHTKSKRASVARSAVVRHRGSDSSMER
ncbi:MAG: glycosyltransferase family 2 protein [Polyangiaceae bacterium]|nr:glycosyltransferase family 2 protein [Polyangiaceae bacterium]